MGQWCLRGFHRGKTAADEAAENKKQNKNRSLVFRDLFFS